MAISTPKDKYFSVWLIFFMLGLGTLLPWNFFMTATAYFTSRLKDPPSSEPSANQTAAPRGVLESKFNNVMTLCAMLSLLLLTCVNSFLLTLVSQRLRVMGSLLVIMAVFSVTAVLVKVPLEPLTFFCVTMVTIVIINSFGAVLQGSLFGMAGLLPAPYTTPIMSGQGLAGTFAAFAMICAIASGSELHDAAFGYFITACGVIFLSVLSYIMLPKLEFFQFYQELSSRQRTEEELTSVRLTEDEQAANQMKPQKVSMFGIFKKVWPLALSVCFTFSVTIGSFPSVTADVRSSLADGGSWDQYYVPVCCFLLFNLCDWCGRSLTAVCMWPRKDSALLHVCVLCRCVFVPLFMFCNVQPRFHLPVYFLHDAFFIIFIILFAFSNGYLASLCMCYGPKNVLPHEAETAGAIMAFFLSLGLAFGAALSFPIRALI